MKFHLEFDSADPGDLTRIQAILRTFVISDAMTLPSAGEALDPDREASEPTASIPAAAAPRRRAPRRAATSTNGAATSEPAEVAAATDEDATVEDSPEPETATEDTIAALREQLAFEWRRVATGYGVIRARDLATSIVNSGRIVPNAEAVPTVNLEQTLTAFQSVI